MPKVEKKTPNGEKASDVLFVEADIDIEVPGNAVMFNDGDFESLKDVFKDINLEKVRSIKLSKNSYGFEACQWLATEILSKLTNVSIIDFSDMFTSRLKTDIPPALAVMMDALLDKEVKVLDLSHNAFGPIGVSSFEKFLSVCPTLKSLNVTNCGLGPTGGTMIAAALEKNQKLMLTEFYASRSKLEQDGMEAMATRVFAKQKCLEKVDVSQNGSKQGLRHLFDALGKCGNIKHVNVDDNHANKAIKEMAAFIRESGSSLQYLNISNLNLKKKNCKIIAHELIETLPESALEELVWNYDLNCSTSTAQEFLSGLANLEKS